MNSELEKLLERVCELMWQETEGKCKGIVPQQIYFPDGSAVGLLIEVHLIQQSVQQEDNRK